MAITYILQHASARWDLEKYKRVYTRKYKLIESTNTYDEAMILSYFLSNVIIPAQTHPNDLGVGLKSLQIDHMPVADGPHWLINASWDSEVPDEDENKQDPTNRDPKPRWYFEEVERFYDTDLEGKRIENSAKEAFLNPPAMIYAIPVLTVEHYKAENFFNATKNRETAMKINSTTWNGWTAGKVLHMPTEASREFDKEIGRYWKLTDTFKFNVLVDANNAAEKWNAHLVDCGLNERIGVDGAGKSKYRRIIDAATGMPVQVPALLNGAGLKAAEGAAISYKDYTIYNSINFNTYFPWRL